MANTKHKLMIAYLEISDWVKNYKNFNKLSQENITDNLNNALQFSHISEEDQFDITKSILELFKIVKR